VGGTISEVTGGKFANGAVTAAIGYVYNQSQHPKQPQLDSLDPKSERYARAWAEVLNEGSNGRVRYVAVETETGWTVQQASIRAAEAGPGTKYAESVYNASSVPACAGFCAGIGTFAAATFGDISDSSRREALNTAKEAQAFADDALDALQEAPNSKVRTLANKLSKFSLPLRIAIIAPAANNNIQACYESCRQRFPDRVVE